MSFLALTPQGFTFYNPKTQVMESVAKDNRNYKKILEAVKAKDYAALPTLMNPAAEVKQFSKGKMEVKDGIIICDNEPVDMKISKKILAMIEAGLDSDPLMNFIRNVRQNPSMIAQDELLLFCEANGFAIDEDGYIIAFKGVQNDYLSCTADSKTGERLKNHVGAVVEMARNKVDDRRDVTCSFGLHFGALEYAKGFGARVMVVRVHPRDVVSIPSDYNNQKGRCCKYEVLSEVRKTALSQDVPEKEVYTRKDFPPQRVEGDKTVPVVPGLDSHQDVVSKSGKLWFKIVGKDLRAGDAKLVWPSGPWSERGDANAALQRWRDKLNDAGKDASSIELRYQVTVVGPFKSRDIARAATLRDYQQYIVATN